MTPLDRALKGVELKAFQAANGLKPDGIAGPKTWAAIWRSFGFELGEPMIHYQKRAKPVAYAVQHHSDTRTVAAMVGALNGKKTKSTHISVDQAGIKRMHLDPVLFVAWHCPGANLQSVGLDAIHKRGDEFTPAQIKALGEVHRDLAMVFGYPPVVKVGRVVKVPKGKPVLPGQMQVGGQLLPGGGVGIYEHGQIQGTLCPDGFPTAACLET